MGDLVDVKEGTPCAFTAMKKSRPTDIIGHQKSAIELENRVAELTAYHEEEMIALQNAFKRQNADLQKKLTEQEREYDMLLGRLEESRTARECTLQEFNALSDKHDDMQKYFKNQLAELTKEKDALKDALDKLRAAKVEAAAAEAEELDKLKADFARLGEEKTKILVEIEQKDRDARYRERILASKSAKLSDTQKELEKTKEEMQKIQSELETLREFRSSWDENQQALVEKTRRIEELEKKVASLHNGNDKLKQTLIVLDEQLKEFEMTLIDKNDEIRALQEQRKDLESKNSVTANALKVARNEVMSINTFKVSMQQELKKAESTLEKISKERDSAVTELQQKLAKLTSANQELEEECESVLARSQELETANAHLQACVDALRVECGDHRDENSIVVNQYIREKNVNSQREAEIEELKTTNEQMLIKMEAMEEQIALLEFEKNEMEVKLSTMLKQQIKLIEYLQTENEILTTKKKKTFVGRILGRDKDKEPFVPPSPSSKVATLPAKIKEKETPSCVLREQNIVKYLEAEANKLRLQLSYCKAHDSASDKENSGKEETEVTPSGSKLQQLSQGHDKVKLRSTESQTTPFNNVNIGQGDAESDTAAALAAMDRAVGEEYEFTDRDDSDMSGISGFERDLYFAERQKQEFNRHHHHHHRGEVTETDTDG